MSILDFFGKRPSFSDSIAQADSTPNARLLDVRTAEEYASGHIPGSVNVPLNLIPSAKFEKDAPLFVYCLSGSRSGRACTYLAKQGYTATNIGGIAGYRGPLA